MSGFRESRWVFREGLRSTVVARAVPAFLWLCVLAMGTVTAQTMGAPACGELANGYGPYDYINPKHYREKLKIVEGAHFTPDVEALKKGGNTGSLAKDIDYTLRAFPNHHRALYAMSRYQLKMKGRGGARYTMECYFDRAVRMNARDGKVRLLWGLHLHKLGKYDEALKRYKEALSMIPEQESADLHYNMGLLYTDMGRYDEALKHARIAYGKGYPLPGLRIRLQKHGYKLGRLADSQQQQE